VGERVAQKDKEPYIRGLIKKGLQFILKGSIRSTINNIIRDSIPQEWYVYKKGVFSVMSATLCYSYLKLPLSCYLCRRCRSGGGEWDTEV